MGQRKPGKLADAKVQFLRWCGRQSQLLGKIPLVFVPSAVKLNSQRYISKILEAELLPGHVSTLMARRERTFQQDTAPSHSSKMTQSWIRAHIPAFISKNEWPSRSPNLNPFEFSLWIIFESRVCRTPFHSVYQLKSKSRREWDLILQDIVRGSCEAFQARLESFIKN